VGLSRRVGRRVHFDRNELAGSFGDIGTDLPLIAGIILATGLDAGGVFIVFGLLQIATGMIYGLPMPMQPLKAMAVIVITQKIAGSVLLGAGLAIGVTMLVLTLTGALTLLAKWIPRCVVRGVQFGLGLSLASLALGRYVPSMGSTGYLLAGAGLLTILLLWGNRRIPAGLIVIALGVVYAAATDLRIGTIAEGFGLSIPTFHLPGMQDILTGFVILALPQIPLSLSNSVIATEQTIRDLFPGRRVSLKKIGATYGIVNLVAPLLGGIPVCHGCGGLAGHYAFGARSGGSVVIYGSFFLTVGLFFATPLDEVLKAFPLPILGIVLLFEALTLLVLVRDQAPVTRDLLIALLVGVIALTTPQGFLVGLLVGTVVYYGFQRFGRSGPEEEAHPELVR
jgi:MFS superfamily sulfate permease-like transporter